jgi:hypothetical protein
MSPCRGSGPDVRGSRYRRLVITPAQRAGRTEEQWQLATTATEELISRGSSPEPMAGPKHGPTNVIRLRV